jgi:hypothetical protein
MRYGCTVINATRLGEFLYDKELAEYDDEGYDGWIDDGDRSDEQFDRMDRQNELR